MDPTLAKILWASFLGVAVGAAIGVLVAAAGKRRESQARSANLQAFRYILEGDPDAAIEALAISGPDPASAIATGVALGAHFRRRGDWSRAIRIHQALLRSPGLGPEWRRALTLELGLDFRGAGMYSQAVEVLEGLVARDPDHREALLLLRQMSEDSGDWERALAYHEAWERIAGPSPSVHCHLLVALARVRMREGDIEAVGPLLERARSRHPHSLDLRLAEAELLAEKGEVEATLRCAAAIVEEKPALVFQVLRLVERAAPERVLPFLKERLARLGDHRFLRLALARRYREEGEHGRAAELLGRLLEETPGWTEARQTLGRIILEGGDTEELRTHLGSILMDTGRARRLFACKLCGVELAEFWFRCPSCSVWDSVDEAAIGEPDVISRPHDADRPTLPRVEAG